MFDQYATFSDLGISPELCEALRAAGISRPTRAQVAAIPRLLNGLKTQMEYFRDLRAAETEFEELQTKSDSSELAGADDAIDDTAAPPLEYLPPSPPYNDTDDVLLLGAETGSGKTLAYLLPFLEALRQFPDTGVKAVVLMPSRELCAQVLRLLRTYVPDPPRALVLAGGLPPDVSDIPSVRIFIATPAALLNHMRFSARSDKNDKYIVVDEADMLLSGSFRGEVEKILQQASMKPFATRRNTVERARNRNRLVFVGATFPHWTGERVKSIVTWMRARYPGVVEEHTDDIHRRSARLSSTWRHVKDEEDRDAALCEVLRAAEPAEKIMVFAATATNVDRARTAAEAGLGAALISEKFGEALTLHKNMLPAERAEALQKFSDSTARVLFCTDLASRGLDLGLVTRVLELEFASNVVGHLHRIGRTARAGARGRTDHFYDDVSKPLAEAIRDRDDRNENVVDGVFSRNRSFRRKFKKSMAEVEASETEAMVQGVVEAATDAEVEMEAARVEAEAEGK